MSNSGELDCGERRQWQRELSSVCRLGELSLATICRHLSALAERLDAVHDGLK
jgi:hypothetical protein